MGKANRAISLGITALILIAIILIVGFGVYLSYTFNTTGTTSSSNSSKATYCVVADTGYVYLQAVSSSGEGIGNVSVLETPKANYCYGYPPFPTPTEQQTNATGYVAFGGLQSNYYYLISLNYSGRSYNFTLPQGPGEYTMATYSLPAGSLSILLCTSQPYLCNSYTSTSYTNTPQVTTLTGHF